MIPALLWLVGATILGGAAVWLAMTGRGRVAQQREKVLARAVVELGHDLRGALSPAVLMSERLTQHEDASVRQSGEIIIQALDRATELSRAASRLAREHDPGL